MRATWFMHRKALVSAVAALSFLLLAGCAIAAGGHWLITVFPYAGAAMVVWKFIGPTDHARLREALDELLAEGREANAGEP